MSDIPYGTCQCGCGTPTRLAPYTRSERGWVKDQPVRYVHGHSNRSSPNQYEVEQATGCWVWQLRLDRKGYGMLGDRGAHRAFYEQHIGPIPEGLEIDHLCRNRACVNPAHLEAVTRTENVRRSASTTLTREAVVVIRSTDEDPQVLADRFGVTAKYVARVRGGYNWDLGEVTA